MSEIQSGAIIDIRSDTEKSKDWKFEEVVASASPVNWVEKPESQWRKFPIFNQNGSGSCVAQTEAKEIGIMRFLKDGNYVHFSATDIYQRRNNKPNTGMGAIDARQIVTKGATLEVLSPSQSMTDEQMDSATIEPYKREVGSVFSVPNYLEAPVKDIETIASIIQTTRKGIMTWFYFTGSEWGTRPTIINHDLPLEAQSTIRHSVTAVDFTLLPDGKKALIIEDSWGPGAGIGGQRIIDEDFFAIRNWYAGYLVNFKFDDQTADKPKHTFNIDLEFGMIHNEVRWLQDVLKYEGLFPKNAESTGYYGGITMSSVKAFQDRYDIAHIGNQGYGRTGPRTRAKLNEIYS
jgi:hypothetical protein